MGPLVMYLTPTKWLLDPHVDKFENNTVGMGMHKIVKQMGKADLKNRMKIVTPKKWLIVTQNWRHYKHPLVAPPNLGANLTSWTIVSHPQESLHQIDED